jgi:hypothetical protein
MKILNSTEIDVNIIHLVIFLKNTIYSQSMKRFCLSQADVIRPVWTICYERENITMFNFNLN